MYGETSLGFSPLPRPLTSFIGRETELAEIKTLLISGPLLTLTGPGGCGKTRLALEVATALAPTFSDGVWWTDLGDLSDPTLLIQAVALAVGVREQPGQPFLTTLIDHIRPREALLVLDNCEHVVEACAYLAEALLQACPALFMLATSREALGALGETVWTAPPLPLPEAERLFVERAQAVVPSFHLNANHQTTVSHICRRLDGIPLAIELAAARVKVLSVEQIARRLDDVFRLLIGNDRSAAPRHQTLHAAIAWSYGLLSPPERALFRRLSVFVGGFTLEAAEETAADLVLHPKSDLSLTPHSPHLNLDVLDA